MPLKVLGVCGSLRENSYSSRAVRACLETIPQFGAETRLLDLSKTELPMYRPDAKQAPTIVTDVNEMVKWADAFLLGSPDYHGTMSGAMKNFLDYHWEEFAGKLFGYICASHEKGLTVMDEMRTTVRQCYGWSMPYGISIHGEHDFDAKGAIVNPKLTDRLAMLSRDLAIYGTLLREQFTRDAAAKLRDSFATRFA